MNDIDWQKAFLTVLDEKLEIKGQLEHMKHYAATLEALNEELMGAIEKNNKKSKVPSTFLNILLIIVLCIGFGFIVTGCANHNYTRTDDGLYYCHADGKYYTDVTKDFCGD